MARKIAVSDKAIALAALEEVAQTFEEAYSGPAEVGAFPAFLVEVASKVRFQPSTRQLVLTFDLDMSGAADQSQTGPEGS